jgi:hypothetical protein
MHDELRVVMFLVVDSLLYGRVVLVCSNSPRSSRRFALNPISDSGLSWWRFRGFGTEMGDYGMDYGFPK